MIADSFELKLSIPLAAIINLHIPYNYKLMVNSKVSKQYSYPSKNDINSNKKFSINKQTNIDNYLLPNLKGNNSITINKPEPEKPKETLKTPKTHKTEPLIIEPIKKPVIQYIKLDELGHTIISFDHDHSKLQLILAHLEKIGHFKNAPPLLSECGYDYPINLEELNSSDFEDLYRLCEKIKKKAVDK